MNGLIMPDDFPADHYEAVHHKVGAKYAGRPESQLFFEALNAIAYRFKALADYDQSFAASFNPPRDGQPYRYEQERDLFGFFSNGYSVFEAFAFALFAVGALMDPSRFQLKAPNDEQNVTWGAMLKAYRRRFPGDTILNVLDGIHNDSALNNLRAIRHILTHRAVPGRVLQASFGPAPSPPPDSIPRLNGLELHPRTTARLRSYVVRLLERGLGAMRNFV
jgi:hypothetical protein